MDQKKKQIFVVMTMYWCLCMLIQQVLNIKTIVLGYEMEKCSLFVLKELNITIYLWEGIRGAPKIPSHLIFFKLKKMIPFYGCFRLQIVAILWGQPSRIPSNIIFQENYKN
jgi:hypothetical protein